MLICVNITDRQKKYYTSEPKKKFFAENIIFQEKIFWVENIIFQKKNFFTQVDYVFVCVKYKYKRFFVYN